MRLHNNTTQTNKIVNALDCMRSFFYAKLISFNDSHTQYTENERTKYFGQSANKQQKKMQIKWREIFAFHNPNISRWMTLCSELNVLDIFAHYSLNPIGMGEYDVVSFVFLWKSDNNLPRLFICSTSKCMTSINSENSKIKLENSNQTKQIHTNIETTVWLELHSERTNKRNTQTNYENG